MRDYLTLRHKLKKRGDFSAILHFTVAVNSSIMNTTHSLKWERSCTYSADQLYFTSYDRHYIWVSMSFWCYLMYKLACRGCGVITNKTKYGWSNLRYILYMTEGMTPLELNMRVFVNLFHPKYSLSNLLWFGGYSFVLVFVLITAMCNS